MVRNLHDKPFDESTIAKLEIFEDYAQAWIPTFVMQKTPLICIFDFFAGTGYDKNEIPGSPIRILKKLQEQKGNLFQKGVKVEVHLNEYEPNKKKQEKFEQLKASGDAFMKEDKSLANRVDIVYHNKDFRVLFDELFPKIKLNPSLVYLDQNGVKFLAKEYLLSFEKAKQTDFLYFVSASYCWRFWKEYDFHKYLDIDLDDVKSGEYKFIHRYITERLEQKLPKETALKLYPFSLKKGSNIYGIIFGATHPKAVEKFLSIAWKRNGVNGDANFDIDEDTKKGQFDLFGDHNLTKKQSFKEEIRAQVLSGHITNNYDLLNFAYSKGHIGSHASECLQDMKKRGEVTFEGKSPLVTYDKVFKKKKKVYYKVLNNQNSE